MGGGVNLWHVAPALYYRMVEEVVRRSVAAHGPPTRRDFDQKLVRANTGRISVCSAQRDR